MCMLVLNTCEGEEESGGERLILKRTGREDMQRKKASTSLRGLRKTSHVTRDKFHTKRTENGKDLEMGRY